MFAQHHLYKESSLERVIIAKNHLCREMTLQGHLCPELSLHIFIFAQSHLFEKSSLQSLLCKEVIYATSCFCIEATLHWAVFAHGHLYTESSLHRVIFAQSSFKALSLQRRLCKNTGSFLQSFPCMESFESFLLKVIFAQSHWCIDFSENGHMPRLFFYIVYVNSNSLLGPKGPVAFSLSH